ncbi:MAG: class I SAM-dependent methyltransferase [Candidatus Pacebacteria bacterium]|nr:class I SAM-dependent methyltransferase [Candidatus Paceibacterota bacterium]
MKYDLKYFKWQKNIGEFGGIANKFKFKQHINLNDKVIDFGSGGGYLLKNIISKEKIGIEINDIARKEALKIGVKSVKYISEIPDNYADTIISNHALEHVDCPLSVISKLKKKLKNKGSIIFIVPHQGPREKFSKNDINQHLYTWNRLTLGNLFKKAGFKDIKVYNIKHKWPPHYYKIYSLFGLKIFNFTSYVYAIYKNNYQIKIVAKKYENH